MERAREWGLSSGFCCDGHGLLPPIAFVVFSMSQNTSDVYQLPVVSDANDEPVFVAANIEDGQQPGIRLYAVGMGEDPTHIQQVLPIGGKSGLEPGSQRGFGVRVFGPKVAQGLLADDPH
jgi:hypothetical protein